MRKNTTARCAFVDIHYDNTSSFSECAVNVPTEFRTDSFQSKRKTYSDYCYRRNMYTRQYRLKDKQTKKKKEMLDILYFRATGILRYSDEMSISYFFRDDKSSLQFQFLYTGITYLLLWYLSRAQFLLVNLT